MIFAAIQDGSTRHIRRKCVKRMMDRRFRVWGSILLLLQLGTLGAPMVRAQTAACIQDCTIWPNAAVPTRADDGPDRSVELG